MLILKNTNSIYYEVLELIPLNDQEREEYKDSWQKFRFALLRHELAPKKYQYVVASMVGYDSWGQGFYFNDLEPAKSYLNDLEKEYMA